jgi:hypothetical protein
MSPKPKTKPVPVPDIPVIDPNQGVKKAEAAPPKLYERGTWLHERDGDLNPTWVFVAIYLILGAAVSVGAIVNGSGLAITAALSFLGTVIVALLISALPIAKSKVLSRARLTGVAVEAEAGVAITKETGGA